MENGLLAIELVREVPEQLKPRRIAIGTSVIGGMLTATILAIFYIPLFFVLVRRGVRDGLIMVRERIRQKREAAA